MKQTKIIVLVFVFQMLLTSAANAQNVSADEGKIIFSARCTSCHNVNKKLTGPALAKVDERHSEAWIINFIKGSQAMIKAGDKEALEVYNQNNQVVMPDHPDLNDGQIKDILAYIKEESKNAKADAAPFDRPVARVPHLMPLSIYNYPFMIGYFILVIIIIGLLIFLVNIKSYENRVHPDES